MAFFEDFFEGWSSGGLVGVMAVVAAPTVIPIVGAMVRPLARGVGEGFLVITDTVRNAVGATGEGLREMADWNENGEGARARRTNAQGRREGESRAMLKNQARASKPRNQAVANATKSKKARAAA